MKEEEEEHRGLRPSSQRTGVLDLVSEDEREGRLYWELGRHDATR